jgi:hypothetical protein
MILNSDYRDILSAFSAETVHVLSVEDMIINKRAAGRTKDMADVEMLEGNIGQ